MPQLSKKVTKIISLSLFVVTVIIKSVCYIIIDGLMDTPCIAGWHVNEELANNLLLITIGFIPDIFMILCIAAGMMFKCCNIGADPGTIVYNFVVGFLCIGAFFPFIGVKDCGSENLSSIKLLGVLAIVAGIFHLSNAVACLLYLAREEKMDPRPLAMEPSTSRGRKGSPPKSKGRTASGKKSPPKKLSPKKSPSKKPPPKRKPAKK